MKHFVFIIDGKYELVYSTNLRQAEKDMRMTCVAAFLSAHDATKFIEMMNKTFEL